MRTCALVGLVAVFLTAIASHSFSQDNDVATDVRITTLSTMLTEFQGVGEWGFAALVEVDGNRLLFDTGERPETVLQNAAELGVDLSAVEQAFLSHNHFDHTGGLTTLRAEMRKKNPDALSLTHVGDGIFLERVLSEEAIKALPPISPHLLVPSTQVRDEYRELGGRFETHAEPAEIFQGVWVTGPIPRVHPERNWTLFGQIKTADGLIEDTIPEDQALVIETDKGLVVVAGCGHAGIVNTLDYARKFTGTDTVFAVIGGFHLMGATDEQLAWTGGMMKEWGVQHLIGAHCTGINAVTHLRDAADLDTRTAVVGSVGMTFTLERGIRPGLLTR